MRSTPSADYPRHAALWELVCTHTHDADLAHDQLHVMRVYDWALRLAPEAHVDPDLAGATALVHDLVNIPKEHVDRPLGSERSAEASRGLLAEAGYTATDIADIVEAVRTCSWSRGLEPTGNLGIVLQDADRLDAIGAIGVARTFACAQAMAGRGQSSRFYDPSDPLAESNRPLDDARQPVDHFRAKLLHLSQTMHLKTAKTEGARRHQAMESFLAALKLDIGA